MQSESFINFNCDRCQRPIRAAARLIGQKSKCPKCKRNIVIGRIFMDEHHTIARSAAEERRNVRRFFVQDARVRLEDGTRGKGMRLKDLSTSGLGLKGNRVVERLVSLEEGEPVKVSLDLPAYFDNLSLEGRVERVERGGKRGGLQVGIKFTRSEIKIISKIRRLGENPSMRNCTRAQKG